MSDNENDTESMLKALDDFLNHKEASPKLSNQQLDALEHYLDSHAAQNAMHMEVLDGFLCALITSPSPVHAEEYLPVIFGGKMPEFKSHEESDQIMGALAQHWEHIDSVLKRNDEYYPFLYADPDGKCSANEWTYGFILGMDMRRDSWKEMVEDGKQNQEGLLTPVLTLYSEYIPEISGCQPIPAEEREELVTKMISNLPRIYEHFEEAREKNRQTSSLH